MINLALIHDQHGTPVGVRLNQTTYSPEALALLVTRVGELERELANALAESQHNAVIASLNYQEAIHFREQRDAALAEIAKLRVRLAQLYKVPV